MIIRGSRAELGRKAAVIIAEALRNVLEQRPLAILGVVGGSSVGGVLGHLGEQTLAFNRVHLFMIDERLVPTTHPDSNFQVVASFVEPYLPEANLHPYHHEEADPGASLERYRRLLVDYGGRFDVALLSAGADGHIASLFPEHETIRSDQPFFLLTATAPKPPPGRMSASKTLIGNAGSVVLLFFGHEKRAAFIDFLADEHAVEHCPARLVKRVPERFILTDCNEGSA